MRHRLLGHLLGHHSSSDTNYGRNNEVTIGGISPDEAKAVSRHSDPNLTNTQVVSETIFTGPLPYSKIE